MNNKDVMIYIWEKVIFKDFLWNYDFCEDESNLEIYVMNLFSEPATLLKMI